MGDRLRVKRLSHTAILPKYQTAGAAGLDLHADGRGAYGNWGHGIARVPTGLAIEIPAGYVGLIRPRSSVAERGIHVVEATIDSDYRGELHIQVHCPVRFENGERIAQLVIVAAPQFALVEVDELSETARGAGSFGSTGV